VAASRTATHKKQPGFERVAARWVARWSHRAGRWVYTNGQTRVRELVTDTRVYTGVRADNFATWGRAPVVKDLTTGTRYHAQSPELARTIGGDHERAEKDWEKQHDRDATALTWWQRLWLWLTGKDATDVLLKRRAERAAGQRGFLSTDVGGRHSDTSPYRAPDYDWSPSANPALHYVCNRCQGNGADPDHHGDACHGCDGEGYVRGDNWYATHRDPPPHYTPPDDPTPAETEGEKPVVASLEGLSENIDPFLYPEHLPEHFRNAATRARRVAEDYDELSNDEEKRRGAIEAEIDYMEGADLEPAVIAPLREILDDVVHAHQAMSDQARRWDDIADKFVHASRAAAAEYGDNKVPRFDKANGS
jgi:hypothetical protein